MIRLSNHIYRKRFLQFHAILCHFLMNDTGEGGLEETKTKFCMEEKDSKNDNMQVKYLLKGPIDKKNWKILRLKAKIE